MREDYGHEFPIPMVITAQYQKWGLVLLATGLPAFLLGVFFLWAKSPASLAEAESTRLRPSKLVGTIWKWVWSIPNLLAIGGGVGAAVGVWFKEYWSNPTWGAQGILDGWVLFGLLFAAFTAAATGLSAGFDHAQARSSRIASDRSGSTGGTP